MVETGANNKCYSNQYINKEGDTKEQRRNREAMEVRRRGRKMEKIYREREERKREIEKQATVLIIP
jgi:hypothetical protein